MADLNQRFRLAAIALPFMFLVMSGLAQANTIIVNTTAGGSVVSKCTLEDAVKAANTHAIVKACAAGSGNDTIKFVVTGTIGIFAQMTITDASLLIKGPPLGGITIDGGGSVRLIDHEGTALTLMNLTLANGFATAGGAIFENSTDLEISNCTFRNNTARNDSYIYGGLGGAIEENSAGTINIVNSTFVSNTAVVGTAGASYGGAINSFSFSNVLKLSNVTFSGNSAVHGGAYSSNPAPSVKSTIFANSTGNNCYGTAPTDVDFNISDDASCAFSMGSSLNSTDPLLDPFGLGNNGGPTQTIALQASSPAIDRVSNGNCSDQSGNPLVDDQRHYPRPDPEDGTGVCDSGAFEFGALAPVVLNSHKVQIARSTTPTSDKVNLALDFTFNHDGDADCDDDALHFGMLVNLIGGTCASLSNPGLALNLSPFVVHTIGTSSYGTLFQSGPPTVSAKIVTLATPINACGRWNLTVAVAKASTSSLGNGPFALIISDGSDNDTCFDITDAQVSTQIPHLTRKGLRR
jgi:hypothetical protein